MLVHPPRQLVEVIQSAWDPEVSVHHLGELVRADPDLSDSILRYANSPFLGLGREVEDPLRATLLLGSKVIGNLSVCHALTAAVRRIDLPEATMRTFWADCVRRACAAVALAKRHAEVQTDLAFIVGLTLEFGRIMMLGDAPAEVLRIADIRQLCGTERLEVETEVFGKHHYEAFLADAEAWGLPEALLEAVARHHEPVDELPTLCRIARWTDLAAECYSAAERGPARDRVERILMVEDGWDRQGARAMLNGIAGAMRAAAEMLNLNIGDQTGLDQLVRRETGISNPETMSREELLAYLYELKEERDHLYKSLQAAQAELQALTQFDQLTGLANRSRYIQTLRQEVSRCQRYGQELSVVIVDVDNFTSLNARYGQNAGDQVLKRVAALLGRISRDVDFLARIGGDEFAVLLPETNHAGGRVFAERVRAGLEALRVDVGDSRILLSGTVVGVTLGSLGGEVTHEIVHAAAMRAAAGMRGRGGNRASWAA